MKFMDNPLYRDFLLSHYHAPKNYGLMADFDAEQKEDNPLCGDSLTMRLKFAGDRVAAVSFVSEGCVISRASASLFSEHIRGKLKSEIQNLAVSDVLALLRAPISASRISCVLLGWGAAKKMLG